jgi:urease accessory protein
MPDGGGANPVPQPAIDRRGLLELEFRRGPGGRTHIGPQYFSYPFHVCRPFYLDDGPCEGMATIYTQSCSGGLYSLDRLAMKIVARKDAQVHLTSQASTIVHRATDGLTAQACDVAVEAGALVEYLPDPIILFPGAHLKSSLRVTLAESASAILFDSFLPHDHEGGFKTFERFENSVEICGPSGALLAIERFKVAGEAFIHGGVGIAGGFACHGSVLAVAPGMDADAVIGKLRSMTGERGDCAIGFSRLPLINGLSARILAHNAVSMRKAMVAVWRQFRRAVTGCEPGHRRK